MPPHNPIAAVTHPDPYPYYAELTARTPLYRDETLGLWVAADAASVRAVLTSDCCRVRPSTEPVPQALLGSPAGDIFRHLMRMNDGERHCPFKQAVAATLAGVDTGQPAERSTTWAKVLARDITPVSPARAMDFAFQLPVYVLADALGVPSDRLPQTAAWLGDFARCIAPSAGPEQVERGNEAAMQLIGLFGALLAEQTSGSDHGLLAALAREAKRVGRPDIDVIIANGIGFLSQAYEATAGLIGNTLVALGRHAAARERIAAEPGLLHQVILEVLRYDPPVQNTRRFLARNGTVGGQEMNQGDGILVVPAAANRDPSANPHPDRFDIFRPDRHIFTFGVGVHACPGEVLAVTIAQAGVARLIASGIDLDQFAGAVVYRDSGNVRIPLFT